MIPDKHSQHRCCNMPIQLTEQQWADAQRDAETPVRVSDPSQQTTFVLIPADVYERFKSLFEEDPVTEQERRAQLQQFGGRAGWDDSAMDVYDDLDPRRSARHRPERPAEPSPGWSPPTADGTLGCKAI
jgi:hypothetical protein